MKKTLWAIFMGLVISTQGHLSANASECLWYNTTDASITRGACDSQVNNADGTGTLGASYLVWTQCNTGLCNSIEDKYTMTTTTSSIALEEMIAILNSNDKAAISAVLQNIKIILPTLADDPNIDDQALGNLYAAINTALSTLRSFNIS